MFFQANPDSRAGESSVSLLPVEEKLLLLVLLAGAEGAEVWRFGDLVDVDIILSVGMLNCIHLSCQCC